MYLKNIFHVFTVGINMTNSRPVASNDQKSNTPATPQQQNQTNPQKPADKPAEQQK